MKKFLLSTQSKDSALQNVRNLMSYARLDKLRPRQITLMCIEYRITKATSICQRQLEFVAAPANTPDGVDRSSRRRMPPQVLRRVDEVRINVDLGASCKTGETSSFSPDLRLLRWDRPTLLSIMCCHQTPHDAHGEAEPCPRARCYRITGTPFNRSCSRGSRVNLARWASATSCSSRFWNWCGSRLFCPTSAAR